MDRTRSTCDKIIN